MAIPAIDGVIPARGEDGIIAVQPLDNIILVIAGQLVTMLGPAQIFDAVIDIPVRRIDSGGSRLDIKHIRLRCIFQLEFCGDRFHLVIGEELPQRCLMIRMARKFGNAAKVIQLGNNQIIGQLTCPDILRFQENKFITSILNIGHGEDNFARIWATRFWGNNPVTVIVMRWQHDADALGIPLFGDMLPIPIQTGSWIAMFIRASKGRGQDDCVSKLIDNIASAIPGLKDNIAIAIYRQNKGAAAIPCCGDSFASIIAYVDLDLITFCVQGELGHQLVIFNIGAD